MRTFFYIVRLLCEALSEWQIGGIPYREWMLYLFLRHKVLFSARIIVVAIVIILVFVFVFVRLINISHSIFMRCSIAKSLLCLSRTFFFIFWFCAYVRQEFLGMLVIFWKIKFWDDREDSGMRKFLVEVVARRIFLHLVFEDSELVRFLQSSNSSFSALWWKYGNIKRKNKVTARELWQFFYKVHSEKLEY